MSLDPRIADFLRECRRSVHFLSALCALLLIKIDLSTTGLFFSDKVFAPQFPFSPTFETSFPASEAEVENERTSLSESDKEVMATIIRKGKSNKDTKQSEDFAEENCQLW